jgi:hypothetical protein
VTWNSFFTGTQKAEIRQFYGVEHYDSKKTRNLLYDFIVSDKDESKTLMNRENFMFLLDNE